MSDEDENEPLSIRLLRMVSAGQTHQELEKFNLSKDSILQRLRCSVYAATDQPNGPGEAAALHTLRQWAKSSAKLEKIVMELDHHHRKAWRDAFVAALDLTLKYVEVREGECQCVHCKERRGDL